MKGYFDGYPRSVNLDDLDAHEDVLLYHGTDYGHMRFFQRLGVQGQDKANELAQVPTFYTTNSRTGALTYQRVRNWSAAPVLLVFRVKSAILRG